MLAPFINQVLLGDNLAILQQLPSNVIDMVYLDPPFGSSRHYRATHPNGEVRTFSDVWEHLDDYLNWLHPRVLELHRIMKPTATFYLHCDWHANAYIRVQILDVIFGRKNFRNELIWHYETGGIPKRDFARKHDTIFRYTKTNDYYFDAQSIRESRSEEVLRRLATGIESATRARGQLRHPSDIIRIPALNAMAHERVKYPTQKPIELLQHLILASTQANQIILDACCGSGTTLIAAQRLQRQWIGIDQNPQAVAIATQRLLTTK